MVAFVSNERRASTSVETRPGDDLEDAQAELDAEPVDRAADDGVLGRRPAPASFFAQPSASSTTCAYSFICAAAMMSDGLVVASRGLNLRIALMSPVSATTTVICESCSRRDCAMGGTASFAGGEGAMAGGFGLLARPPSRPSPRRSGGKEALCALPRSCGGGLMAIASKEGGGGRHGGRWGHEKKPPGSSRNRGADRGKCLPRPTSARAFARAVLYCGSTVSSPASRAASPARPVGSPPVPSSFP